MAQRPPAGVPKTPAHTPEVACTGFKSRQGSTRLKASFERIRTAPRAGCLTALTTHGGSTATMLNASAGIPKLS